MIALAWIRAALTTTMAPRFCATLALAHLISATVWLANITQQHNLVPFKVLWWAPVAIDILGMLIPVVGQLIRGVKKTNEKRDPDAFIPIDYHLYDERMGLITLLAMGESVTAASSVELHGESPKLTYLHSILVVATVFGLNMLYYRSGEALIKEGKHALRATVIRGVFWILLHIPLIFFMLLKGSVAEIIIDNLHDSPAIRLLYCISAGSIFVISALLQSLHEGGGKVEKKWSKLTRLSIRWACGALIILVGFIPQTWTDASIVILGVVACITGVGVGLDTFGSLPLEICTKNFNHRELQDATVQIH